MQSVSRSDGVRLHPEGCNVWRVMGVDVHIVGRMNTVAMVAIRAVKRSWRWRCRRWGAKHPHEIVTPRAAEHALFDCKDAGMVIA